MAAPDPFEATFARLGGGSGRGGKADWGIPTLVGRQRLTALGRAGRRCPCGWVRLAGAC